MSERATTGTVADIPDEELLRRAVRSAGATGSPQARQWAVRDAFALGSTYAAQLCVRFGLDPDEEVGIEPDFDTEDADG